MKKLLSCLVLSLATTAVYADVVDFNVTQPIPNQPWQFDGAKVTSYRFNDQTDKAMVLTMSLDSKAIGPVSVYCWNKNSPPPPTLEINPGQTFQCSATDTIKVTGDPGVVYSGSFSVDLDTPKKTA